MTVLRSPRSILARASATLIIAAAVPIFLGAADQLQDAMSRLQSMSTRQRTEITDALQRFELKIPPEEQKSIRELDRQIHALAPEERTRYLAVLRRYHNWLDTLPDTVKDNLLASAPEQRMPRIRTLLSRYPVPRGQTPNWMQFIEFSGPSFFELATLFKIWQDLSARERSEIEKMSVSKRREKLLEHGFQKRAFREFRPDDFRLEEWIPKVQAKIAELHEADPELQTAMAKAEKKLEELAKEKPLAKRRARSPILRRLAINLYMLSQDPHPVSAEKLDAFFAAMPSWVQSSFDPYPADEARRRLTLVYRLVFPHPAEFQTAKHAENPQQDVKSATGHGPGTGSPVLPGNRPPAPRQAPAAPKVPPRSSASPF